MIAKIDSAPRNGFVKQWRIYNSWILIGYVMIKGTRFNLMNRLQFNITEISFTWLGQSVYDVSYIKNTGPSCSKSGSVVTYWILIYLLGSTFQTLNNWRHVHPGACLSEVPKLFGSISGVTIPFISSQRRGSKPSNFAIPLVFLSLKTR